MKISVVTAVVRALARTKYVLFTTFDINKWLLLAVCAFLAQCDAGGGAGYNFGNFTSSIPSPPPPPAPPPAPTTAPTTAPTQAPTTAPAAPSTQAPTPASPPAAANPTDPGIPTDAATPETSPSANGTISGVSVSQTNGVKIELDSDALEQWARSASSSSFPFLPQLPGMPSPTGGQAPQSTTQKLRGWVDWIEAHIDVVIVVVSIGLLIGLAFTALLSWISCRGRFMFIDGIVHNRGAVLEPWSAFKQLGNSLFGWSFALNVLGLLTTIAIIAGAAAIALPDIRNERFGTPAIMTTIIGAVLLIASTLAFALVRMVLHDFVVPAMYLHNLRVLPAWHMVRHELIAGYVGEIVLFYLMGIVITVASTAITTGVSCLTCCITTIPLVGTIILLPLLVFRRCYGLCFIEQFGPRWTVFFDPSQRCLKCGYDLRYATASPVCPECGTTREFWTPAPTMPPTAPPTAPR